ncbi:37039_t:CDS:2, partial [Racocetra persica]
RPKHDGLKRKRLTAFEALFLEKASEAKIFLFCPREALELLTSLPDNTASLIFLDPQYEKVGTVLKLDYPLSYTTDYQILRILEQISRVLKPKESQLASNKRDHPHQKPRELIKALITATTNKGDLIADPCAGSFIVLDACQELKREFIEKNLDSNQFEIRVNQNEFDTKEQGVFYQGLLRIHFYDLFSYQRVRGAIARTSFAEIVFEEAIPIDQEFLPREQHDFRDLVKSLKGRKGKDGQKIPTKITFLANAYSW